LEFLKEGSDMGKLYKSWLTILLLAFIGLFGVFFCQKTALAAYVLDSTTDYGLITNASANGTQKLPPPAENLTIGTDGAGHANFRLKLKNTTGETSQYFGRIVVYKAGPGGGTKDFSTACNDGNFAADFDGYYWIPDTCRTSSNSYLKDYIFETDATYYTIQMGWPWGNYMANYGSDADTYLPGQGYDCSLDCAGLTDLNMIIGSYTPPATTTIAIEFPANESTGVPDFLAFNISFMSSEIFGSTPWEPALWVQMCYGTDQASVGDCQNDSDTWPTKTIDGETYPNPLPGTTQLKALIKSKALASSTTYYGKAYLKDIYGRYLNESPEMAWTTATSTMPPPEAVSSTLSEANDWTGLLNLIKQKPPVGYFTSVVGAWSGLNSTSTAAVSMPNFGPISDWIFTPIRTGLIFVWWLSFGVYLYHRMRHIKL
jgi:hypothetical protein